MKVPWPKDPNRRVMLMMVTITVFAVAVSLDAIRDGNPWAAVVVMVLLVFPWVSVLSQRRTVTTLDDELGRELAELAHRFTQGDVRANDEVGFIAYRVRGRRVTLLRRFRKDVDEATSDLLTGAKISTVPVDMFHILGGKPSVVISRFHDVETVALDEDGDVVPVQAHPELEEERKDEARGRSRIYRETAKRLRTQRMVAKYLLFQFRTGASRVTRGEVEELVGQLRAVLDGE